VNPRRSYSRHGLHVLKVAVKARGFGSIDGRTAAARALLSFRAELITALGGEAELSPQQRKLVDLAARASLYVDHVDAWLTEQRSLVNHRNRTLLPALVQRQALAEHLAKLLDRLGLERRTQKVPDLHDYLRDKYRDPGADPTNPKGGEA
jgi:hypothetical protein